MAICRMAGCRTPNRSRWRVCTRDWREQTCRVGMIDHWMHVRRKAGVVGPWLASVGLGGRGEHDAELASYNACSFHKPSGPGWSLCQ